MRFERQQDIDRENKAMRAIAATDTIGNTKS